MPGFHWIAFALQRGAVLWSAISLIFLLAGTAKAVQLVGDQPCAIFRWDAIQGRRSLFSGAQPVSAAGSACPRWP